MEVKWKLLDYGNWMTSLKWFSCLILQNPDKESDPNFKVKDFPEKAQDIFIEAHLCLNKYVNSPSYTPHYNFSAAIILDGFFFLQVRILEWETFLREIIGAWSYPWLLSLRLEFSPFGLAQLYWPEC